MKRPYNVFCCYAHEDAQYLKELKKHLLSLEREGLILVQTDIDISPGREWKRELDYHLENADIILLLISPDFVASEYCFNNEMVRAIARHEQGTACVVPVIIRPTHWQALPFSKLQALPQNAKPVSNWQNRDDAFFDVAVGIKKIVQPLTTNTSATLPFSEAREQREQETLDTYRRREERNTGSNNSYGNMTFNGPVSGCAFGPVSGDYININMSEQKDGLQSLQKGAKALWQGYYETARAELGIAIDDLKGKDQRKAAQACYFSALALLGGNLPYTQGKHIVQAVDAQMNRAIELNPSCASYYRMFACIKKDVFEHIKVLSRPDEVRSLEEKGYFLARSRDDEENEKYFRHCQPRLQL